MNSSLVDPEGRESMTMEQKIAEIQREVREQGLQTETELANEPEEAKLNDKILGEDEEIPDIPLPDDFVDQGKIIKWPTVRTLLQLAALLTATQGFFFAFIFLFERLGRQLPQLSDAVGAVFGGGQSNNIIN